MGTTHDRQTQGMHARAATLSMALLLLVAGVVAVFFSGSTHATSGVTLYDEEITLALPEQGEYVRIHLLFADDGSQLIEEIVEEARERTLAGFPGAVEVHPGQVTAAFVTFTSWNPPGASWTYNDANKPAGLSGEGPVLIAAANAWNGVGGSPWAFSGGGSTTETPDPCVDGGGDGNNVVGWASGSLGGTTLAQTCTWFGEFAREFDMEISPDWNWTIGSPVETDFFTVVMHEFGHALGLRHTQFSNCPGTVMCSRYEEGTTLSGPQEDDIAGVVELYGGSGPPPTPTDTPETETPPSPPSEETPTTPASPSPSSTPTPTATPPPTPPPPANEQRFQVLPGIARD